MDFKGIDFTPGVDRFPKLPYGRHVLEVDSIVDKKTFKGEQAFIVEAKVLSTSNPDVVVGNTYSWYRVTSNDTYGYAAKEVGYFLGALQGFDVRNLEVFEAQFRPHLSAAMFDHASGSAQPFKGRKVQMAISFHGKKENKLAEGFPRVAFAPENTAPLQSISPPPGAILYGGAAAPPPAQYAAPPPPVAAAPWAPPPPPPVAAPVAAQPWSPPPGAYQAPPPVASPPVDPGYAAYLAAQKR